MIGTETEGLTAQLIDLSRSIDFLDLPDKIQRHAKHCVLDTIGVMLAGSTADPVASLCGILLQRDTDGPVTVMIDGFPRTGPVDAALINGTIAHTMDYDDAGAGGHISGALVPAALALAELCDASGRAFLSALVAGYETSFRLSRLLSESCYERGFHASALVAPFAAAVTGSHLLALTELQWEMALGITGSLSSGLRSNFATMTKGLHSGHAASNGVLACLLAKDDFTGASNVLESRAGFMGAHTGASVEEMLIHPLGEPYTLEEMVYKQNAACASTHSAADGLRSLIFEQGIAPDEVEKVVVRVPSVAIPGCDIKQPTSIFEIKFSIVFMGAAGALGYNTGEGFFVDDLSCDDPRITEFAKRIQVELLPGVRHGGLNEIEVTLTDGSRRTLRLNSITPNSDLEEERNEVVDKFRRCTAGILGARTDEFVERIKYLEEEPSMRAFIRGIGSPTRRPRPRRRVAMVQDALIDGDQEQDGQQSPSA